MDDKALVRVDRNGFSLENITSLPWQTLVVREDGFIDLKGGVTISTTRWIAGVTEVKNHTGATLLDALVLRARRRHPLLRRPSRTATRSRASARPSSS